MKMKIIYDESVNIETQSYDKVLINMSYKEYLDLRTTLLVHDKNSCLDWYKQIVKARENAKFEWKKR